MLVFVKVFFCEFKSFLVNTGPPDGPVLFCTLSSVGVVCNARERSAAAGRMAG